MSGDSGLSKFASSRRRARSDDDRRRSTPWSPRAANRLHPGSSPAASDADKRTRSSQVASCGVTGLAGTSVILQARHLASVPVALVLEENGIHAIERITPHGLRRTFASLRGRRGLHRRTGRLEGPSIGVRRLPEGRKTAGEAVGSVSCRLRRRDLLGSFRQI
jgi:hypothetical protein